MTTQANSQFLTAISLDQRDGTIAITWYDARDSALNHTARCPAWADNSNSTGDNPDVATNFEVYTAIIEVNTASGATTLTGIGNSASYAATSLAPGEIVTLFGAGIGPPVLTMGTFDANGRLPLTLAGVRALFGGTVDPLVYVSDKSIAAIVPFAVAAGGGVRFKWSTRAVSRTPARCP